MTKETELPEDLIQQGWRKEEVFMPSINKKEIRYFKDGFEISEKLLDEIIKVARQQTISDVLKILEEIIRRRTGSKPTILDIEEAIEQISRS